MHLVSLPLLVATFFTAVSVAAIGEDKPAKAPAPAAAPAAAPAEPPKPLVTYADTEAAQHVGEQAIVKGKVMGVGKSQQGNIYLNLGAVFPKQTFSGFIRSKDAEKIGDAKKFEGKIVAITGKIESYNDKPQIVISSPEQIKVIEEAPSAEAAKP